MTQDYGADPIGDGTFRMVPSGDIVGLAERNRRLPPAKGKVNDCVGLTWDEIERRQGGKLRRNHGND